jgi:hypothetical protein
MLGTRALPAHVSLLFFGLTLGCDPPSLEPPDTDPRIEQPDPAPPFEPPDACAALEGSRFRSVEFHDSGENLYGIPTLGRWRISFADGEFDWVHGPTAELGSYTCAGLDVTGLARDGRELSGTFDPLTGLLTWDGAAYVNQAKANVNACAAIDGNGFSGLGASEAGLGPEGVTYSRAGISFDGGEFRWRYSDVVETGSYACDQGRIIGTRSDGSGIHGYYDSVMGILTWEGAQYGDPREFPDADP